MIVATRRKLRRALEARDEFARRFTGTLVVNRQGNVRHIEGRGVAEDQQLNDRRTDDHEPALRVLEQGQEFFVDQCE